MGMTSPGGPERLGGDGEQREERHVEILHALGLLSRVIRGLEELVDRVEGAEKVPMPSSSESTRKDEQPSLAKVLDETPARIKRYAEGIERSVELLKGLLF